MTERATSPTRRRVLRTGVLACAVGIAGCVGGGGGGGSRRGRDDGGSNTSDYGSWLADAPNYEGVAADRTGRDVVTVTVGAGNGLTFGPAAVEVSPGTTVVWEWTGRGGQHNVRADTGAFESELAVAEGTTYERTFDDPGVVRYFCVPHQAVGMKGVVDVVDR